MSTKRSVALAATGMGSLATGALAFFLLLYPPYCAKRARSWPEAPCTIIESRVERYREKDRNYDRPAVRYLYEVDGLSITGSRIHYGAFQDLGDHDSQGTTRAYPLGRILTCRYNPKDPRDSVLVPQVQGVLMPLVGTLAGLIFLTTFFVSWRVWRDSFFTRPS